MFSHCKSDDDSWQEVVSREKGDELWFLSCAERSCRQTARLIKETRGDKRED